MHENENMTTIESRISRLEQQHIDTKEEFRRDMDGIFVKLDEIGRELHGMALKDKERTGYAAGALAVIGALTAAVAALLGYFKN